MKSISARDLIYRIKERQWVRAIANSGLLDREYYLSKYPDLKDSGIDPVLHYVRHGANEGRDPSLNFSTNFYLSASPDVAKSGINPLYHYIKFGRHEGRPATDLSAQIEYIIDSGLLDREFYLKTYADVAASGLDPAMHYLSSGHREGRNPSGLFDTNQYLADHPEVAAQGVNPLMDFLAKGGRRDDLARETRAQTRLISSSGLLDPAYYLERYPDVAAAGFDPAWHYAESGWREGRNPSEQFSTRRYQRRYLQDDNSVNPLVHYLLIGRDRGYEITSSLSRSHESWGSTSRAEWAALFERRLADRRQALKTMNLSRAIPGSAPTFSIITTVYDTDPAFVRHLADTLQGQAYPFFEWLILDNGSTAGNTIETCREIAARDKRFKYFRVEENLHIIGGNRYIFDKVKGHYTVPVDSDDILYPDSLALFANVLREAGDDKPVLIYSDEHKVSEAGEPIEPIWRWDFTFAHAMGTAPAAHLMAYATAAGREVGVYTDDYARGSHDWDTALRLTENGGRGVHVREVLYGWRVHALSTAAATSAKDYITYSQFEVMERSLVRRGLRDKFEVGSLFEGVVGYYVSTRKEVRDQKVNVDFVIDDIDDLPNLEQNLGMAEGAADVRRIVYPTSLKAQIEPIIAEFKVVGRSFASDEGMLRLLNEAPANLFAKGVVSSKVAIQSRRALWDAIGTLELDLNAGLITGPVIDPEETVLSVGLLAGLLGFAASPFYEWLKSEVPGHLWHLPRPVTAAPLFFVAIRAEALRKGLRIKGIDRRDALHGLELGLDCARMGYGVVNIPAMESVSDQGIPEMIGAGSSAKTQLRRKHRELFAAGTIPTYLSHQANRFGMLSRPEEKSRASAIDHKMFAPAVPLSFRVDTDPQAQPTINVLLPGVRMVSMSGGPNTALNLAYQLAKVGFAVRIISTDLPVDADQEPIWRHIQSISGISERLANVEIVDGSDRRKQINIGSKDVFFATAWWTAQMAKHAAPLLGDRPFIYLIQDFEPILYPASSQYAQALETYALDHIPIINTKLLRDFLVENRIGRHGDPAFAKDAVYFEPAISREAFHPEPHKGKKRRLLFYARPNTGQRNLFELGVAALQVAIASGDLGAEAWEFIGMGEPFTSVPLGHDATLECAPWLGFDDYAKQMRQADVLLSLMMSPHPSYPPLEMAACGGVVVTNQYANKTAERMAEISANIIAVEPTVADVAEAIARAVERLEDTEERHAAARVDFPDTWRDALSPVVKALSARLIELGVKPDANTNSNEPRRLQMPDPRRGVDAYAAYLRDALADRKQLYHANQEPGLLSFVSTVWNTPPAFLDVLARSMEAQEGGHDFEWYILDNGCTRPDVIAFLADLAQRPYVRLERVEENLGIIGGMRHCLERAKGRYILPLDSDDYLTPDCVRIVTWHLQKHNYPALAYSDEDKLMGAALSGPYLKPDWDPVLFVNSCYIAHLCAIDREKALELDAYTDGAAEGSHDWDTFTRFVLAGHTPHHISEVVYSWRMHAQSTASNINSKPVVFDSQRSVLTRFLNGHPKGRQFELVKNPMFGATPDWWLRRRRAVAAPGLTTVIVSRVAQPRQPLLHVPMGVDHKVVHVGLREGAAALVEHARAAAADGRLLHVMSDEVSPDNDEWFHEAVGHFELFPETVMAGGRTHSNGELITAGYFFGFGNGCDCPDRGRRIADPGYSAQMWKQHSVSAVSALHAVIKPEFLLRALEETAPWRPSFEMLGVWLGAHARKHGQRVIYSPFISAETKIDWDCLIDERERRDFVSYAMELIPEQHLLSPDLGLTRETAYVPQRRPRSPAQALLPSYAEWQKSQMAVRSAAIPAKTAKTRFSLLTTLYIGSDAALFQLTAKSVLDQRGADFEWVILTHGPVSRDLRNILKDVSNDERVRLLTLQDNLGIVGGMQHVLAAATGDYIVPLDGDDLLAIDCLSLLAQAIEAQAEPAAFLYTDEDIVIGETWQAPYLRPDWDPVLDLENSWIWHTCAYRRDLALQLGVYQFKGSEYCHDWDTVYRFAKAGFTPLRVPMITYHWRHHARSTSNSGDSNNGSSRSVQALLAAKISDRGLDAVCSVSPFPIYRGAEEWWIERHANDLPPIHSLTLPVSLAEGATKPAAILQDQLRVLKTAGPNDLVVLQSTGAQPTGGTWIREAVKIFEFHDDVAVVSGRLVGGAAVIAAGWMTDAAGNLQAPYDGLALTDPGPFVLGWKPQSISAGVIDLCVVRAGFLREALSAAPAHLALEDLGLWLGAQAVKSNRRVAFSPLIEAKINGKTLHPTDRRTSQAAWDQMIGDHPLAKTAPNRGAAAYGVKRFL